MSDPRRLLLVVGVGRSGTSLLAGILGQVGLHIPQPEVQADDTNPRGFGEPRWVVDFHRKLMRARRITVFDARPAAWELTATAAADPEVVGELRTWLGGEFAQADVVAVKDPRSGWFLPLWTRCSAEIGVPTSTVTMLRHPAEILTSARKSYGDWQTDASRAASWLNVMLETERATRGASRTYLRYEDLLADWARELARAGAQLDLPALAGIERERFPAVDEFVDPTLHRNRTGWDGLTVPASVRELADAVWEQLQRLTDPAVDEAAVHARLDAARERYVALYGEAEAIAQSSVTAVKPRKRPGGGAAARRPVTPPSATTRVKIAIARRLPASVRARLRGRG